MLSKKESGYISLHKIFGEINSNINIYNVIELIKSKLKEGISNTDKGYSQNSSDLFESWKAANFAIDHEFRVQSNGMNPDAHKLLGIAIRSEHFNVATALVKAGADISQPYYGEGDTYTSLHEAFTIPCVDLFKACMERQIIIASNEQALTMLEEFTKFSLDQNSPNKKNAEIARSRVKCVKMLIDYILKENPDMEIPNSIENNEELRKHWNTYEARIEGFTMVNPDTAVQEMVSFQQSSKIKKDKSCIIQ